MTARIVPLGDDWMLSETEQVYAATRAPATVRLAADLATGHPRARTTEWRRHRTTVSRTGTHLRKPEAARHSWIGSVPRGEAARPGP